MQYFKYKLQLFDINFINCNYLVRNVMTFKFIEIRKDKNSLSFVRQQLANFDFNINESKKDWTDYSN